MKRYYWYTVGVGGGLTLFSYLLYFRKQPKRVIHRMKEPEDVDAYNTDDGQPPFEEHDPRQRSLRR